MDCVRLECVRKDKTLPRLTLSHIEFSQCRMAELLIGARSQLAYMFVTIGFHLEAAHLAFHTNLEP